MAKPVLKKVKMALNEKKKKKKVNLGYAVVGTSQEKRHNKNEILKVSVSACQSSKLTFLSPSTSVSAMASSIINFSVKISHQPST